MILEVNCYFILIMVIISAITTLIDIVREIIRKLKTSVCHTSLQSLSQTACYLNIKIVQCYLLRTSVLMCLTLGIH